jgi:asparagine synthase (glutamine-hydrolysing)
MKYLAKKALRTRVPQEILDRKKAGFPVPYESWFRQDLNGWVRDILLDERTLNRGYFQRATIENMITRNQQGHWNSQDIFSLVVLELWHRAFVDQKPVLV